MKRKLTGILLMSALLVGGASTFVSCKDYDGDQVALTNAQLTELQSYIEQNCKDLFGEDGNGGIIGELVNAGLIDANGNMPEAIKNALLNLPNTTSDAKEALELAKKAQAAAAAAQAAADAAKGTANQAVADAAAAKAIADANKEWINANADLAQLTGKVQAIVELLGYKDLLVKLDGMKKTWGEDFENVIVKEELLKLCYTKDEVYGKDDVYNKDEVDGLLNNHYTKEEIDKMLKELGYEKIEDMETDVKKIINDWTAAISGEEGAIKSYEDLVKAFNTLPAELEKINDAFEAIEKRLGTLESNLNIVNNKVAGLVTGINIDMVDNPYFGTLNTPFGIKSTMLIGFVGGEIENVNFAGEVIGGKAQSVNGGALYLTINPNDINAENMNINLVGRDGKDAPGYELEALVRDNSKVTTVTTRAAAVNGYKAVANIENADLCKINVNKTELANVAKQVLNKLRGQGAIDVVKSVQTIYNTFANAIDQYYALQYVWNEVQEDGTIKERAVTSDYNIAATTISPLSYASLEGRGVTFQSIPQLQEFLGIDLADYHFEWKDLGQMADVEASVTVEIPDASNVKIDGVPAPEVQINEDKVVTIPSYKDATLGSGETLTYIDDVEVKILDGVVTIGDIDFSKAVVTFDTKKETYSATVSMDDFNKMINDINSQVGGMMDKVNDLVDKIDNGINKINNNVISRLNSVIAKVNKITENPNALLQPIMFYSDANGAGRLSESALAPTRFNLNGQAEGSITLVPTSYTAEMLAPAYKKSVRVTSGSGASVDVKGVFDGNKRTVVFTAKPGKYTIQYDAIDYYGHVRPKTYYVEVK